MMAACRLPAAEPARKACTGASQQPAVRAQGAGLQQRHLRKRGDGLCRAGQHAAACAVGLEDHRALRAQPARPGPPAAGFQADQLACIEMEPTCRLQLVSACLSGGPDKERWQATHRVRDAPQQAGSAPPLQQGGQGGTRAAWSLPVRLLVHPAGCRG